ncbi:uncharacterized protein LOC106175404 [Lingula anatina]|uniref:Uncharacterized protein LOC106175404 n=1 Tax=Lingula anatina TaxID=7574 RepID=A0A2R2MJS4_LINAN|nr:uncharacterized protein LOC106175404 [Lingula anatina]|eukprot:XP_023930460.1 uncharacterized protein LOC106175404 [Lingula anatina]
MLPGKTKENVATSTTSLPSTTTTTATTTTPIPSSLPSTTTTTAVTTTPIPSCPQPPIVQDADLLTTGPFIAHRRIEYQCHTGFKMTGLSNDMLCDGNLQWTGSPPQCLRTCPTPPVIANAVVKSTGPYTSGDTVEYECSAGFLMTGQATRTCGNRFTWEGSSPSCNPTCPNPPGVANAHLSSAGPYPVGSQASYACGSDFQMDGSPTLTCGSGLQWQGSPPTCKPIDRSPRIETNQHINWPSGYFNTTQPFNSNATSSGVTPALVTMDSSTSRNLATTFAYTPAAFVPHPTTPYFPQNQQEQPTQSIVTPNTFTGHNQHRPLSNSLFSLLTSIPPLCPQPLGIPNGEIISNGPYHPADLVIYRCLPGFVMNARTTSQVCGSSGYWIGAPPQCHVLPKSPPAPAPPSVKNNQMVFINISLYWGNGKNTGSTFTGDTGGGFPTWLGILLGVIFGLLLLGLLAWLIWACCCGGGCCGVQGCMGGGGGTAGCQGCCPRRTHVANETEYVRYSKESPVAQKRVVKKKITRQNNEPEYDVEHAYDHVEIIHLDDDQEPKRQNKSYGPNVRKEVHFHENDLKDRARPLKSTNKQTPPEVVENVYYHHKTRRSAPKEDPKPRRRSPSPSPSPPPPASPSPVQQVIHYYSSKPPQPGLDPRSHSSPHPLSSPRSEAEDSDSSRRKRPRPRQNDDADSQPSRTSKRSADDYDPVDGSPSYPNDFRGKYPDDKYYRRRPHLRNWPSDVEGDTPSTVGSPVSPRSDATISPTQVASQLIDSMQGSPLPQATPRNLKPRNPSNDSIRESNNDRPGLNHKNTSYSPAEHMNGHLYEKPIKSTYARPKVIRNEIHVIEDSPPSSQQTTPRAPPPPPVIQPVQPPAPPKKRLKNDKLQEVIHAVVVNKKKKKIENPQKPLWWPHSKPVRQINTSTK